MGYTTKTAVAEWQLIQLSLFKRGNGIGVGVKVVHTVLGWLSPRLGRRYHILLRGVTYQYIYSVYNYTAV